MNSTQPPCWRTDLSVTVTSDADGRCVHVEDRVTGKFYRIGETEFTLLSRLDGRQTWQDAVRDTNQSFGPQAFSTEDLQTIIQWAFRNKLLTTGPADDVPSQTPDEPFLRPKPAQWSLLSIRVPLGCPDQLCVNVLPWVNWLFGKMAFVCWLFLMVFAANEVFVAWDQIIFASAEILVPSNWLSLGLAWLALKVIHESAHALVCKRHGGEVREVGFALIVFAPVAYVDVTSCWRFASRWPRIQTALAGIYAEMACAAVAILAAGQVESMELRNFLDNVAVMASVTTLLFNINPLSRFDGYFVLADLSRVPNLYARGRGAAGQFVRRWLLGVVTAARPISFWLTIYGIATWLWSISVMFGLIVGASLYWHGWGLILSAVIALNWIGSSIVRATKNVGRSSSTERIRLAIRLSLLAMASVTLLAFAPWPFGITAPGVVEFSPLSVVRAEGAGFVTRVLVEEGDVVTEGQPLLELRNEELERERRDLELSVEQSHVRERLAVEQHDTATSQIEQQQRSAMRSRLAERQRQVERLTLRAPSDGVVIGRQLQNLEGVFVAEGRELLSVGDPTHREFMVAVRQEDLPAVQSRMNQTVAIRLQGRGEILGRVDRIRPRASVTPEHLCLCAPFGGPLAVQNRADETERTNSTQAFELLEPRFWLTVSLDQPIDRSPLAGEVGTLRLSPHHTCAQELQSRLSRWFNFGRPRNDLASTVHFK